MGEIIRAFRLHPWHGEPIHQATAAAWLGVTQTQLSRIENGQAVSDLTKLTQWALILEVPAELLWFKLPGTTVLAHETRVESMPDVLHRLAGSAADESLSFAEQATELMTGDEQVDHLRWELSRIAVDYVHAPLSSIFRDLVETRDELFGLLAHRQRPQRSRNLYFLGGLSCLLLAHASQNVGNQRAALVQLRTAWTCAEVANDDALRAWSRGTAALVNEWTSHQGTAVELATEGARFRSSRQSRIRLAAIEARAAARMGDRKVSLDAIAQIQAARGGPSDQDDVTAFGGLLSFPEAKGQYYLGSTFGLLGEHEKAEQYAQSAIAAYETGPPAERSYGDEALARLDIVNSRIARGDFDGATAAITPVLELPAERRIRQLHTAVNRTSGLLEQSRAPGATALLGQLAEYQRTGVSALPSS
ncbi:hypothetical protein [Amycolatopsis sp. NPDC059657]|uniref:hypothetical protein n=1 Tax=Amycolatopsis sp. NPDC059657 TaxID=3346899 RepID=UPI0036719374